MKTKTTKPPTSRQMLDFLERYHLRLDCEVYLGSWEWSVYCWDKLPYDFRQRHVYAQGKTAREAIEEAMKKLT